MHGFQLDMMSNGVSGGAANAIAGGTNSTILGQTATGASQGTAFLCLGSTVEFTTVAASTGALLPAAGGNSRVSTSDCITIVNNGANSLSVYPPVGFKIGTTATNGAVAVAAGKAGVFMARGDGNYFAIVSA